MQSCLQKNETKHEKWACGSQVSLGEYFIMYILAVTLPISWFYRVAG